MTDIRIIVPTALGGVQPTSDPIPQYSALKTYLLEQANETGTNFANGPTNSGDSSYTENGSRSIYYAPYYGLRKADAWATRTSTSINDNSGGWDRALKVYLDQWNDNGTQAYRRFAEVPYLAVELGDGGDRTAVTGDIINACDEFSFSTLSSYGMGTAEDRTYAYHGRYTLYSREVAYFLKAVCYHEAGGLGTYDDPFQSGNPTIRPYMVDAAVSNIWRFMNELYFTPSQGLYDTDDTAYFMLALTASALRIWKWAEAETSSDWSSDWPSQVMDGEWDGSNASSVPLITNPWTDVTDMMNELLDWAFGAIDGYTTDTASAPKMADYFRVAETHTDAYSGSHTIGDPMIVPVSTWYQTRHRNTGVFEGAYLDPQLQIFCASMLYWGAVLNKGVDNARGNKYIRWGDEILNGVVEVGDPFTQKEKNQNMIYIFDALEDRNTFTGRND